MYKSEFMSLIWYINRSGNGTGYASVPVKMYDGRRHRDMLRRGYVRCKERVVPAGSVEVNCGGINDTYGRLLGFLYIDAKYGLCNLHVVSCPATPDDSATLLINQQVFSSLSLLDPPCVPLCLSP